MRWAAPGGARTPNHKLIQPGGRGRDCRRHHRAERILEEPRSEKSGGVSVTLDGPAPGDRMAICWAHFGQAPDLSLGVDPIVPGKLYHACQALDFSGLGNNQCAPPEVFHTCIGSNKCKAQGGCGFVQQTTGGGICGHAMGTRGPLSAGGCGAPQQTTCSIRRRATTSAHLRRLRRANLGRAGLSEERYHAAVRLHRQRQCAGPIGKMNFSEGELVHDVAYRAYLAVMQHRGQNPPRRAPSGWPFRRRRDAAGGRGAAWCGPGLVSSGKPRLGLPNLGDGVGLRDTHFPHLMRTDPSQWGSIGSRSSARISSTITVIPRMCWIA